MWNRSFYPETRHDDTPEEVYYNKTARFGSFLEEGSAYRIETRQTPRPWLFYLCNDKVRSCVAADGKGFLWQVRRGAVTKYWEYNYLVRDVNGARRLWINGTEFFENASDFSETVRPGCADFSGKVGELSVSVRLFVPERLPGERWLVRIEGAKAPIHVVAAIDWMDFEAPRLEQSECAVIHEASASGLFTADSVRGIHTLRKVEKDHLGRDRIITETYLDAVLLPQAPSWCVTCGAFETEEEKQELLQAPHPEEELEAVFRGWQERLDRNRCEIPEKNLERFLNVWLKNQIFLIHRYDRAVNAYGYRDSLQDAWGSCLVDPEEAVDRMLITLSYMFADGRCPREFQTHSTWMDRNDFADSPVWAPAALYAYICETGHAEVLDQEIGFCESDERSSVMDHLWRSLDYLYHARGENGLLLMRGGDWADGLGGINRYGDGATSVWLTIAAYWAQGFLKKLCLLRGETDRAAEMERRSAEYKEIVNRVGWDGSWYAYGFFADGEPIGSHRNLEGKIWLNPQTWAIFTGIADQAKTEKIQKAIHRYLFTPFGSMVCYPPYVNHGARCGRVQRQLPGTFLNGSVYNHGATFQVFADLARGDSDDALDTFLRALPNHPDNSDSQRTSEPFTVGNVYYGSANPRYGMNLFSWFTASPDWLIHAGFEEMLGVKAGFDALEIDPHPPTDWKSYTVWKTWRGTRYRFDFQKSDSPRILVDGAPVESNHVRSSAKECLVQVFY